MHQGLYLKGICPNFSKWSHFKRFDDEVLQERTDNAQKLLIFIASHPPLFTSKDFVNFFQSSYPDPTTKIHTDPPGKIEEIRNSLLLPIDATKPLEYQSSEEDSYSIIDSPNVSTLDSTSMNSSIVRQDLSIQSNNSIPKINVNLTITDDDTTGSNDNAEALQSEDSPSVNETRSCIYNVSFKSNLPDLILFGNSNRMERSTTSMDRSVTSIDSDNSTYYSNSQYSLESDKNNEQVLVNSLNRLANISESSSQNNLKSEVFPSQNIANSLIENMSALNETKDLGIGFIPDWKNHNADRQFGFNETKMDIKNNNSISSSTSKTLDNKSLKSQYSVDELSIASTVDLQENYVFEAGYLLSLGAKNEAKGNYQSAFDSYKFGIEKLLIGVQEDENELRRQFVKDKVNKYLSHAEKIYVRYLNSDDELLENKKTYTKPIPKIDLSNTELCETYQNLSKYKVLSIISEQVMLVLCSETQECYAMKVIQKICNSVSDDDYLEKGFIDNSHPNLPVNIPYMVRLKSYIETPNLLFLVLQYASGGRLFDYIQNYTKSTLNTPVREVNLENVFVNLDNFNESMKKPVNSQYINILESSISDVSTRIQTLESKELQSEVENSSIPKTIRSDCDDLSVNDLVINSQRLLLDVDDALSGNFLKLNVSEQSVLMDNNKESKSDLTSEPSSVLTEVEEKLKLEDLVPINVSPRNCALPPKSICKWGAELLTAIDHLHQCGVICRTLQPKNLLLGDHGHLILSYFIGRDLQNSILPFFDIYDNGSPINLYIAPELQHYPFLNEYDHLNEKVCDFWSFGAIMYELIVGMPLSTMHPTGFNSHTILNFPEVLSSEIEDFLTRLLTYDPLERLGSKSTEIDEIKSHPYFKQIDWKAIDSPNVLIHNDISN